MLVGLLVELGRLFFRLMAVVVSTCLAHFARHLAIRAFAVESSLASSLSSH